MICDTWTHFVAMISSACSPSHALLLFVLWEWNEFQRLLPLEVLQLWRTLMFSLTFMKVTYCRLTIPITSYCSKCTAVLRWGLWTTKLRLQHALSKTKLYSIDPVSMGMVPASHPLPTRLAFPAGIFVFEIHLKTAITAITGDSEMYTGDVIACLEGDYKFVQTDCFLRDFRSSVCVQSCIKHLSGG